MGRFQVKDNVVLDTKTGLEWKANHSGPMSWKEAVALAESLGVGWRLPTIEELISLIDLERYNPTSDFPGMPSYGFWSSSSSSYTGASSYAWVIYFYDGSVSYVGESDTYYVRCVRGPVSVEGG